jgi:FG-GAP-like repeat/Abnormal spindle-like microcephaly-assoc'd, ASPM-SPD-2-Hydin
MSRSYVRVSATVLVVLCIPGLILPVSAQFETRGASSPLPSLSFSIALGDFNHDGKLDAAVVDFLTVPGQVAVLLGNGNGTFQAPVYYPVGFEPESVAVADFNHDGNLDLAVSGETDLGNGCIFILFGSGDGTFQPAICLPLSAYSTFVAVADFNGDGTPDLLAADFPYISVLLGNGDGTFQAPINNDSFSPTPPDAVGIGDFNRDGKLDVVVVGSFYTGSQATVLLGNGDGSFQLEASYPIVDAPNSVAVADFRSIGKLDLVIGSYLFSEIGVLLGNGDGTFQPQVNYLTPGTSSYLATSDLNGDGKVDLVVAGSTAGYATVFLGNGDGTFQPGVNYFVSASDSGYIVAGDLNGDRKPDLAVFVTGNEVVVMLNTGVVSFSPTTPVSFAPQLIGTTSSAQNVTLTNTGTTALSISSTRVVGPFQLGSHTTCGSSVPAGGKCTLSAVFKPTAMGSVAGLLSISDSASTKPQVIELSGAGTVISFSPAGLNFGTQKVGTKSAPQNVTVTNTGSTAVSVTGVNITGRPNDYSQTNTCGSQIGPGANCTISVTFAPIRTGKRYANVQITDSGGGGSQSVPLRGTGD